jgi:predicted phosphohydrolase
MKPEMTMTKKIRLFSDLHLEFLDDINATLFINNLDIKKDEIVVLAGDVCSHLALIKTLKQFCALAQHVIYVPGNHEFYGASVEAVEKLLASRPIAETENLHVLNDSFVVIDEQRFIGGTLWFEDTPQARIQKKYLSDFTYIREFEPWVFNKNRSTLKYLAANVLPTDVVVTHHMPSHECVGLKFRGSELNCYFVSPTCTRILLDNQPKLWLHGHGHSAVNMKMLETRIVCNPGGYPGSAEVTGFDPGLEIDV